MLSRRAGLSATAGLSCSPCYWPMFWVCKLLSAGLLKQLGILVDFSGCAVCGFFWNVGNVCVIDVAKWQKISHKHKHNKSENIIEKYMYTVWVKPPPAVFPNGWEFLVTFLHTYYTFQFALDCEFLFSYLQLWRSYAILSETTHRIFLHFTRT